MRATLSFILLLLVALTAPAAAQTAETIQTRQRIFHPENVDPATGSLPADRVILSWAGDMTFAAAIGGHVVLLDAWVVRGGPAVVPTSPEELAALAPEAIFIGHGHFDHALDAPVVAKLSGAKVVGTEEHCKQVRQQAKDQFDPDPTIDCVVAFAEGAAPGGKTELDVLTGVGITAVKHLHSAAVAPDLDEGGPVSAERKHPIDLAVLQALVLNPPPPEKLADVRGDGDEGGSVLYQFRVGAFALVWHDTSGPLKENAPEVFEVFRSLAPTDVQVGAIQTFNEPTNGFRDPRMYVETIAPKVFVPGHHDAPVAEGATAEPPLRAEMEKISEDKRPELRFLFPPGDYIRPEVLTYDVDDPRWQQP